MNGNNNLNNRQNDSKIDLVDVDFSRNRETDVIRQNEERERERRRRAAEQLRRKDLIRQKKINRMKRLVLSWSIIAFALIVVIAIIIGIISLFNKTDKKDVGLQGAVPEAETQLVNSFVQGENSLYFADVNNDPYQKIDEYFSEYSFTEDACFGYNSLLKYYAKTFASGSPDMREDVKKAVRDCAMYSNGYVWSQEKSMKFEKTNSYLYDTNASFISAVAEICKWEASAGFLNQIDVNQQPNKDISGGLTVGEKFDKALKFYFDEDDINGGGIRYNKNDGLVYVLTRENDGTNTGLPSNIFYNYRFGYLDLYNNIMFYEAMNDAAFVCSLLGDDVNAQKYLEIAAKNKEAINKTFFKDKRFIGCIDENKKGYDYGFCTLNLYAVSSGVADSNKADKILSWINGKSKVNTDTVSSSKINKSMSRPLFSTVEANDSWWFDAKGDAQDVYLFGNYWQNGGASCLGGAFALTGAKEEDKISMLGKFVSGLKNGEFDAADNAAGEPEIFRMFALETLKKQKFGISVDGTTLNIGPYDLGEAVCGIKNISFGGNSYGFLFDAGDVYITALNEGAVKLKIYGFKKGQELNLVTVKDGMIQNTESIIADKEGSVSLSKLFEQNTYFKIEMPKQNKK